MAEPVVCTQLWRESLHYNWNFIQKLSKTDRSGETLLLPCIRVASQLCSCCVRRLLYGLKPIRIPCNKYYIVLLTVYILVKIDFLLNRYCCVVHPLTSYSNLHDEVDNSRNNYQESKLCINTEVSGV